MRACIALWALLTLLSSPALAQTEPAYRNLDANGVDLTHGDSVLTFTEAVAGSGRSALDLVRIRGGRRAFSSWDHLTFRRTQIFSALLITIGNGITAELFSGPNLTPRSGNGSTITSSGGTYTYTAPDGTETVFGNPSGQSSAGNNFCNSQTPSQSSCILVPISITSPDGRTVNLEWELHQVGSIYYYRLDEVTNSHGYAANFAYENNSPAPNTAPPDAWFDRTGTTLSNTARSETIGTVGYSTVSGATKVTDLAGRAWRITGGTGNLTAIRRPGASIDSIAITYSGSTVLSATRDGVTTSYSRSVNGTTATMTVTDALSQQTVVTSNMTVGRPTRVVDPLNRTTDYQYDSFGRLTRVIAPLLNYIEYEYDGRGNIIETHRVAQPNTGVAEIVTTASFDGSCSNPVTCNQPNSTTDARGNVTAFTYDSTHGGVLTVTGPAPTSGADRPQTRYSYTLTNGEYLLTGISTCASGTAPSCVGTAAESRIVIGYDSNGNATSIQRRDGAGALSATTVMTYTAAGDVETSNGPLAGDDDTTRYRYNAARQQIGIVLPDPDGGGSLPHRARRVTYAGNALPILVEQGTVASQSDAAWAQFTSLEGLATAYDAALRLELQRLVSGSTTYALTQTGYDVLGRVRCVTQRMNPTDFASPPTDACDQGSGGADRIARTSYDAAGQVTLVETGVGTGAEADEVATTYTANGRVATVTDGNGNVTTYAYDGHDRLSRTCYPGTTNCGTTPAGAADYEQLTYETTASGTRTSELVASRRLRDSNSIAFAYDALARLITLDPPGSEWILSYEYDLLGRTTRMEDTNTHFVDLTYDALGRALSEATLYGGTVTSDYDLAGRRTRLTHPDSFYVDYEYRVTGEVSAIRERGGTLPCSGTGACLLASYTYDALGRRTGITRGNGTTTAYDYDPLSRLESLTHDVDGSFYDLTLNFTYNAAGQIATRETTNNAYAYLGLTNGSVADTINALNQVTATGSTTVSYGDARGNITAIGSASYGYDSLNRLVTATGAAGYIHYDPAGRFAFIYDPVNGSVVRRYDGQDLIAEFRPGNAPLRRYVHAPGVDEPIVWYEGSGYTSRNWLHADGRGSIVAISDGAGVVQGLNRYDDYGRPESPSGAGPVYGRFGYTGQAWTPEIGLWYYRARMYNPQLGRFMQTDPAGYGAGMNLYAYVLGDPINLTDPSGLSYCLGTRTGSCKYNDSSIAGGASGYSYGGSAPGNSVGGYWRYLPTGEPQPLLDAPVVSIGREWVSFGWSNDFGIWTDGASNCFVVTGCYDNAQPAAHSPAETRCPAGGRITLGLGGGATGFLGVVGATVGFEGGIAVPVQAFSSGSLAGTQFYGAATGGGLLGIGLFGSGGPSVNAGYASTAIESGTSYSYGNQAGLARGVGVEGFVPQGTRDWSGTSVSAGRGGAGLYSALAWRATRTWATRQLGCTQ